MRISEAAAASGCHLETIRYYERIGLLANPPRSSNGYRCYTEEDIDRQGFVVRCRELGFSLDEISSLIALSENPKLSCNKMDMLARKHLADIEAKQHALARLGRELKRMIDDCSRGKRGNSEILAVLRNPVLAHPEQKMKTRGHVRAKTGS